MNAKAFIIKFLLIAFSNKCVSVLHHQRESSCMEVWFETYACLPHANLCKKKFDSQDEENKNQDKYQNS